MTIRVKARSRGRAAVVAACLALPMTLAACGDDDERTAVTVAAARSPLGR